MLQKHGITLNDCEGFFISKKVIIYGVISDREELELDEIKKYILEQKWTLEEAVFDFQGLYDGFLEIADKVNSIDIFLIYNKNNIEDEFILEFFEQLARKGNIKLLEFPST